ncbi:MAG: hypothetical protein DSY33_00575 [Archaeoglobus sp.]|nr:MAG: hypothetical protein DSY33_00575 [Archaeoglobus sp.]
MILIRYGELSLKRNLRKKFEDILVSNIHRVAREEGIVGRVKREWGRIYFSTTHERIVAKRFSFIFGVVSTSPAIECSSELEDIESTAEVFLDDVKRHRSFAIRVRRSGTHEYTSMDVARFVGAKIKEKSDRMVDLKNPDFEIFIEVREEKAYVFSETFKGFGGLPVGTQGRVLAMDEVSAWFALRRGCDIDLSVECSAKDDTGLELLRAWACYRKVGKVELNFKEALKSNYPAIFCSFNMNELIANEGILRKRKMPVLTPLASEKVYSRDKVEKILNSISELIECVHTKCRYSEREQ